VTLVTCVPPTIFSVGAVWFVVLTFIVPAFLKYGGAGDLASTLAASMEQIAKNTIERRDAAVCRVRSVRSGLAVLTRRLDKQVAVAGLSSPALSPSAVPRARECCCLFIGSFQVRSVDLSKVLGGSKALSKGRLTAAAKRDRDANSEAFFSAFQQKAPG
jgi:hypothetical protein